MNLVFTVEEDTGKQTFEGFQALKPVWSDGKMGNLELPPKEAQFIGIVQVEDSFDLWYLENREEAVEELQRYYRMDLGRDVVVKIFTPV